MKKNAFRPGLNPDYHPDRAHLPSPADMVRWKNGGREKEMNEQRKLAAVVARFARVAIANAEKA